MNMVTSTSRRAPVGTCDCHMHIYGPPEDYPLAGTASVAPGFGRLEAYRTIMHDLGISRAVVVQPSAYGLDNRSTLDAMRALGANARGVVVVDENVTDTQLAKMDRQGVRGVRFHMLPGGVLSWDVIETMAARGHAFGWHIQLQMDGRYFHEREALLRRLPGTLVIDHTGKFLDPVDTDHPGYRALLRLLETGHTWVKLSAPYETSKEGPPNYMDVGRLAQGLIAAAPERMVWASNWPHPSAKGKTPDDAALLEVLYHWADAEDIAQHILVDNPALLYGF